MTRMRVWLLTALVALALGINFVLLSPRIAQSAEETVRARLAAATNEVHEQIELRDARLNPRLEAESPELIDSLRPPADPTLPVPKPDEKALRAALAAAQPLDPDLLIVATADGAAYTRHGKPAVLTDDIKELPLVKATLDGAPGPATFAQFDGSLFRVQSAKIPGSVGVVVTGMLIDDRLASQLRAATETDVTLFHNGQIIASSVSEDKRADLQSWEKSPRPGYGAMPLRLMLVGNLLDGKLPRGASRYAVRAASVPLEGGVTAALTISGFQYFGWLGRYQAYYLAACVLFLLFGLVWGLLPGGEPEVSAAAPARPVTLQLPARVSEAAGRAEAALAGANAPDPRHPVTPALRELPWTEAEQGWGNLGQSIKAPVSRPEPAVTPLAKPPEDPFTSNAAAATPAVEASSAGPSPLSAPAAAADTSPLSESPMLAIAAMPLIPEPQTPSGLELDLAASPPPKIDEETKSVESSMASISAPSAAERDPFAFEAPPESAPAKPAAPSDAGLFTELEPSLPGHEPAPQLPPMPGADPFAELGEPTASTPPSPASQPPAAAAPDTSLFDRSAPSFEQPGGESADPFAPLAPVETSPAAPKHDASLPAPTDEFSKPNPAFSFASLLDEDVPPPAQVAAPSRDFADDSDEETHKGPPPAAALHPAPPERGEDHGQGYRDPGDEPTRVEAVSAALLDKLREKDEPEAANHEAPARAAPPHAAPEHGEPEAAPAAAHVEPAHPEPAHDAPAEAQAAAEPPADPDEAHFEDTYRQFIDMRHQTGEPADRVSFDKFVAKLRKNREELLAKHNARGVRFSVYLKDGRAAIKASAIR